MILDPVEGEIPTFFNGKYLAFCYAEEGSTNPKIWQVPKDFRLPKVNHRTGWTFWMKGLSDYCRKQADGSLVAQPISPFCILTRRSPQEEFVMLTL